MQFISITIQNILKKKIAIYITVTFKRLYLCHNEYIYKSFSIYASRVIVFIYIDRVLSDESYFLCVHI